ERVPGGCCHREDVTNTSLVCTDREVDEHALGVDGSAADVRRVAVGLARVLDLGHPGGPAMTLRPRRVRIDLSRFSLARNRVYRSRRPIYPDRVHHELLSRLAPEGDGELRINSHLGPP